MNAKSKKVVKKAIKSGKPRKVAEPTFKKVERQIAAERVDEKKKRLSRAAKMRLSKAASMKKSLETYPKNPKVGRGVWEAADRVGDRGKGSKVGKGKRTAKAKLAGVRAERRAAKAALQAERREERERIRAEKQAVREARKAERIEKRKLANMPAIKITPKQVDAILNTVQAEYSLTDRRVARLRTAVQRMGNFPPRRLRNQLNKLAIRIALMQGVNELVTEALKKAVSSAPASVKKNGSPKTKAAPRKAAPKAESKKPSRKDKADRAALGAAVTMAMSGWTENGGPVRRAVKNGVKAQPAKGKAKGKGRK